MVAIRLKGGTTCLVRRPLVTRVLADKRHSNSLIRQSLGEGGQVTSYFSILHALRVPRQARLELIESSLFHPQIEPIKTKIINGSP